MCLYFCLDKATRSKIRFRPRKSSADDPILGLPSPPRGSKGHQVTPKRPRTAISTPHRGQPPGTPGARPRAQPLGQELDIQAEHRPVARPPHLLGRGLWLGRPNQCLPDHRRYWGGDGSNEPVGVTCRPAPASGWDSARTGGQGVSTGPIPHQSRPGCNPPGRPGLRRRRTQSPRAPSGAARGSPGSRSGAGSAAPPSAG